MAALTPNQVIPTGLTVALTAAAGGGDTVQAGTNSWLHVKNGSGASINVTVAAYPDTSPWGAAIPDLVVAVAAGAERLIGPFPTAQFANPTDGRVYVTYSAVTTVTVANYII